MKLRWTLFLLAAPLSLGQLLTGCRPSGSDHDQHEAHEGHEHEHDEGASQGASFAAGKGITLTEETRRSLNVATTSVAEQKLPHETRFAAQVFGEKHKPNAIESDHTECTARASGLLGQNQADSLRAGMEVKLSSKTGEIFSGLILSVHSSLAIGDAEVVIGITNQGPHLQPGEFLNAAVSVVRDHLAPVIPQSALLRTAEGAFVYVVNGDAYLRKAVITGAEASGQVEIVDGLNVGESVVTQPVEKLWLIELRATKGGGHAH